VEKTLKYHSVYEADQSLAELELLASTAGAEVCGRFVVKLSKINPRSFIGSGKIEEIKESIKNDMGETPPDVIIFDEELSGVQYRNLEESFDMAIIDRTQLILHIFAMRAKTQEGMLEVELAQLEYLLPRLIGFGKVLSRLGGGIGTRGPGETKLEVDRRKIRTRITKVKADLEHIKKHRALHRKQRDEFPYPQISLVGYTNAGKSTLLNSLANSDIFVKDQLFSTLDTTTKKIKLPGSALEVLITDTVGFINKLPHKLVMSFRATLEETVHSDLLLHVVDASNPDFISQIEAVNIVLKELDCVDKPAIIVLNKIDNLADSGSPDIDESKLKDKNMVFVKISAKKKLNFKDLYEAIEKQFAGFIGEYELKAPIANGKLISFIKGFSKILHEQNDGSDINYKIRMYKRHLNVIEPYLKNKSSN
jgi:GTP-binding protein HflX